MSGKKAGMRFSFEELRACAEREANYRRYVYPRRVAEEKMAQRTADKEIAMMEEIAELLKDQQRLL